MFMLLFTIDCFVVRILYYATSVIIFCIQALFVDNVNIKLLTVEYINFRCPNIFTKHDAYNVFHAKTA